MCGRFTLRTRSAALGELFGGEPPPDMVPRYNIAPTQAVAIVRMAPDTSVRQWQTVRWGLIPSWAKDASIGNRMINARAETIADKPSFRTAFRRRRCLVPADGYFEWQKTDSGKQPYYIRLEDDRPFALAGLWESWLNPATNETLQSCTIITTQASPPTQPIHDRMPVILDAADYEIWLDPQLQDPQRLGSLLRPFQGASLRADPVDTYVNSPRNDGPRCIESFLSRGDWR
jgi:putative SOS response-associated peptidase YedK